jgi:DNA polymerase-1
MCKKPKLTYQGPSHPKVIVIGEQPSIQDDNTGHLFSGEDGVKLRKLFTKVGLKHNEVGYANVIACHYGKKPKMEYARCCANNLLKELKKHNAKLELVILLGSLANKVILQKTDMASLAGKIHRIHGIYHLPMIEPSKKQSAGKIKQSERDLQKALALINLNIDSVLDWEMADSERLQELKPKLLNANTLTFDCETSSLDMMDATQFIIGVGFCYDTKNRKGCFVPLEHPNLHISCEEYSKRVSLIREILLSGVPVRAFNGGFDLSWVRQFLGIDIDSVNFVSDPRHAHHLIKKSGSSSKLENLTLDYLPDMGGYDAEVDVLKVQHGTNFAYFPLNKIAPYCVGDCVATARLAEEIFDSQLKKIGSWNLYRNIIVPVIPIYDKISMNGIKLDFEYCNQLEREYAQEVKYLIDKCYDCRVVKKYLPSLDVTKNAQVKHFIYEILKLPKQKDKDTGNVTVNKAAILTLLGLSSVDEDVKEFLICYKDYAVVNTANERYASKWRNWIGWDGLVHPNFNLSGTITGRLATSNPNFAQLSRNQADAQEMTHGEKFMLKWPIRRMLVSRHPNGRLVSCDYSQLELRVMAMLSQDTIMVQTYRDNLYGGDLHTARAVQEHPDYSEQVKSLQKEWRRCAKTSNFAGAYSLSEEFLATYPGLAKYVNKTKSQIRATGKITTVFGRVRQLPWATLPYPDNTEPWEMSREERSNYFRVQKELRKGVNTSIQAPAHTCMEKALIRVNERMLKESVKSDLILEIHDDLLADCIPEEVEQMGTILQEEMEGVVAELDWTNGVPLVAEPEYGWNWAEKTPLVLDKN